MDTLKYQVYIAYSAYKYRIFLSPCPDSDLGILKKQGYNKGETLMPPLPIGVAYYLWQKIATLDEQRGLEIRQEASFWTKIMGRSSKSIASIIKEKKRQALNIGKELGMNSFSSDYLVAQFRAREDCDQRQAVKELLSGRILLPTEVEKLFAERKKEVSENLWRHLQVLWLEEELKVLPAVERVSDGYKCNRCGQSNRLMPVECSKCGSTCIICEECIAMGEARSCVPLIVCPDSASSSLTRQNYQVHLSFNLTLAQRDAAEQVKEFYLGGREESAQQALSPKNCLVWAVCGAGKTEVSFGAIAEALNGGGKVLFAIPRRDVVKELEPRLQRAFPGVTIACLYGGSEDKYKDGQITIATTHQAIRFYRKFALIVLDEADAYPYQGSKMLYHFVQRAKQPSGKIIYMTATPSKELVAQTEQGKLKKITIPARHHGFPLPEPKFLVAPNLDSSKDKLIKIPVEVYQWLHKVVEGDKGQVFIFVPTIKLAEAVAQSLRAGLSVSPFGFPPEWVQFSHSKDPGRDEKRLRFKDGLFPLFVTTSIMERGITVPRAKVLVLFADYERVFDQGTLIQMAGRSGRLDVDPLGEVLFVGKKLTTEIQGSMRVIRRMNKEAREKGYLHVE